MWFDLTTVRGWLRTMTDLADEILRQFVESS